MDEEIMIRYLQGECSGDEETLFLEWLNQSPENKTVFLEYKALWNYRSIKHFGTDEQLNKAAMNLNRNIHLAESRRRKQVYPRVVRYAAIFIFALALPAALYTTYHQLYKDSGLITVSIAQTDSSKFVVLSDGSRIWLNSNSSITYPERFSTNERIVQFTGEAYFEVAHDSLHPFSVQTNNVQVRVLGTSFNVRSYSSERKTETTLVEGKVVIQNKQGNNLAMLTPGQMAEYDKTSQYLSVKAVDTEQYTTWRYGLISLTNVTLEEITQKLSKLYQVHFIINNLKATHTSYNFSFRKDQSLDKVLEMLSFIAPIKYTVQGSEISITAL
ncbi:MAG TPA: FecR domain-containing protein [Cyclobacteriaceae bacterium]